VPLLTSPALARAEVTAALRAAELGVPVFGHEPAPGEAGGQARYVTVATAGVLPTEWLVAVRCYVAGTVGAQRAQDVLDELLVAADAALPLCAGPSRWSVEWDPELGAFVATALLEVGREDL
jgi:hypothetical protein